MDSDLALFFETETEHINLAVKRNKERFPEDFMFQLTEEEYSLLRQNVGTKRGGRRSLPFVFTEMGCWTVSMLLTSDKAKRVGIELMKTFKSMKDHLKAHPALLSGKVQQALLSPNATINLYDSPGAVIILSSGNTSVTQSITVEESVKAIMAVKGLLGKDHEDISKGLDDIATALKDKNGPKAKEILETVETGISAINNAPAAIQAVKLVLPTLWNLIKSLI